MVVDGVNDVRFIDNRAPFLRRIQFLLLHGRQSYNVTVVEDLEEFEIHHDDCDDVYQNRHYTMYHHFCSTDTPPTPPHHVFTINWLNYSVLSCSGGIDCRIVCIPHDQHLNVLVGFSGTMKDQTFAFTTGKGCIAVSVLESHTQTVVFIGMLDVCYRVIECLLLLVVVRGDGWIHLDM